MQLREAACCRNPHNYPQKIGLVFLGINSKQFIRSSWMRWHNKVGPIYFIQAKHPLQVPSVSFLKPFPPALQGIGLIISRPRTSMNAQCKCLKSCTASLPSIVCFRVMREHVGTRDSQEFLFGGFARGREAVVFQCLNGWQCKEEEERLRESVL